MKKTNLLLSMLILTVLSLSVATTTQAALDDYCGVEEDEEISISGNIDLNVLKAMLEEEDWDLKDDFDVEESEVGAFTIDLTIDDIQEIGDSAILNYSVELTDAAGDEMGSGMTVILMMCVSLVYSTVSIGADMITSETPTMGLISATDIDWEKYVEDAQDGLDDDQTLTVEGNGIRTKDSDVDGHEVEMAVSYGDNGVVTLYEYKIDGAMLASIGGGIPGFEMTILLGITAAGAIGLIYIVMKKRK